MMFTNYRFLFASRLFNVGLFVFIALLVTVQTGYGNAQSNDQKQVVLQGAIQLQPAKPVAGDQTGKIQPGTSAKISVTVENTGTEASSPGELYVRYALAHPLGNESVSETFTTEKKALPSIEPGKKVDISFDTPHLIPSLLDFVRDDWSIREYQAVAVVKQQEYLIGSMAITFSAYYYAGLKREMPTALAPN